MLMCASRDLHIKVLAWGNANIKKGRASAHIARRLLVEYGLQNIDPKQIPALLGGKHSESTPNAKEMQTYSTPKTFSGEKDAIRMLETCRATHGDWDFAMSLLEENFPDLKRRFEDLLAHLSVRSKTRTVNG